VDVGTVSSEDVLGSYERQLTEAHRKIAMLEAALERERRAAAQARIARQQSDQVDQSDPQEMP
jgi:phage-related tail protein